MEKELVNLNQSLSSYLPKKSTKEFFTIGYEGKDINSFIEILKKNKVKILIDIREIPISRKKGFSKTLLDYYVGKFGIKYVHIKELGTPKKIRYKFYQNHDFNYLAREYKKYIMDKERYIRQLLVYIEQKKSCIMCFEKDVNRCHRKLISEEIRKVAEPLEVKHLI